MQETLKPVRKAAGWFNLGCCRTPAVNFPFGKAKSQADVCKARGTSAQGEQLLSEFQFHLGPDFQAFLFHTLDSLLVHAYMLIPTFKGA